MSVRDTSGAASGDGRGRTGARAVRDPAAPLPNAPHDAEHPPLHLIAAGGGRHCYAHPGNPALCIKVPFNADGLREARREAAYLAWVERMHGPLEARHLARLHGRVRTTRGEGWVFDRVRDERSGEPAPTLGQALDEAAYAREPIVWERALEAFRYWLGRTPLVVRDLTPENHCVRRTTAGELELVLIDGIGPAGTLPRWLPLRAYARSRNERHAVRYGVTSMPSLLERTREARARRGERVASAAGLGEHATGNREPKRVVDPSSEIVRLIEP